jgi:hypothetical protein
MSEFWELSSGESTRGTAWSDDARCGKLEERYGLMEPWIPTHRVPGVPMPVLLTARKVNDFVWTWYSQCLIQDRVLRMFRDQGFTGYAVHPVSARWKRTPRQNAEEIPTLWELVPTGWGGMAPEESGVRRIEDPRGQGRIVYSPFTDSSMLIDRARWDGSDFFIVYPIASYTFVTDRVAAFIRRERLTGADLQPSEGLAWPWGADEPCIPGPLSLYLPEPRAREIGEPLGIY